MSDKRYIRKLVFSITIPILVFLVIFSGLQILESTVSHNGSTISVPSKTITRDGVDYFPRQDIKVIMLLGIDQFGPVQSSASYNNPGAADLIMLLVFDETNETVQVLGLNRDTMLRMPILGIGGKPAGSIYAQLALSHTYGSGLEDSCENTKKTVSDFLYGVYIDYYISMNMDAITVLNDLVGGVTVTVTEDFSSIDPSIEIGEVTLTGQQAIHFVRSRKDLSNQMNVTRMDRQAEYVESFLKTFRGKMLGDTSLVLFAYEAVLPYIVTDCSTNALVGMIDRYAKYELVEIISPMGENIRGDRYMEFYVDEAELDSLILRTFYAPK